MRINNKIWKRTKTKKLNMLWLCNSTRAVYISIGLFIIALCTSHILKAQNTAYGTDALMRVTTGDRNAGFGYQALYYDTTGYRNTAIGHSALYSNTTGSSNTASGYAALYSNTTGPSNTASGSTALYSNTTGDQNTASGYAALYSNTTGPSNTASGYAALYSNTTGTRNTASGTAALYSNTTGSYNTASGYYALKSNSTGSNNTALGYFSDVTKSNLTYATAIGAEAKVTTSNTIQLGNDSVTKVYAGVGSKATLVAGGLQITGGSLAAGKVLTSDANGVATWQIPMGGGATSSWSLTGTAGTVDSTNFIGTTDNIPFNIRVNNQKAGRIDHIIYNTFYGYKSGNATTGYYNTANGDKALYANTSGSYNTANGAEALYANTTAGYNTANGYHALFKNVTGGDNTATGVNALYSNTTGYYNTANGYEALAYNTTGLYNTSNGYKTLNANTTGSNNTALGYLANVASGNLSNTTVIGSQAIVRESNTIQLGNSLITKVYAGVGNTATLIAGGLQITGGTPALGKILTSDANGTATWQNPAGGGWSLTGNAGMVDGTNFIGTTDNVPFNIRVNNQQAGRIDPISDNTFYGYQSGAATNRGRGNTATGGGALYSNAGGNENTANGYRTLTLNTTGNYNTANGTNALYANTTGNENTANGYRTLTLNKTGNYNTANGSNALYSNTEGNNNIATGYKALYNNTTGNDNTAEGFEALFNNTKGGDNNVIGFRALYNNTTGRSNVAMGNEALYGNKTGENNTAIGADANVSLPDLYNATAVGSEALVNNDNKVVIGNRNVTVIGGYANWTNLSDARFKKNIQKDVHGLDFIMQLKPITYNLDIQKLNSFLGVEERNKNTKQTQAIAAKETIRYNGFLAQEVEQAAAAVQYNFSGVIKPANAKDHYSMSYSDFVVPLVKGMQEQEQKIEQLQKEKEQQQKINDQLQQRIEALEKLMAGNSNLSNEPVNKITTSSAAEGLKLFPNPTTGVFTIMANNINNATIEVYDMLGNSVKKEMLANIKSGYQLDLSGYAKGTYWVNIIAGSKKYTKQIVVQ